MTTATRSRGAPNAKADRHFVTALARGLDLLACFRARDRVLSNQELARRSGLPKSTISRLTYTLTKIGYLEPAELSEGPGYRLGSAVLALGSAVLGRMDMRSIARPLMQELADRSHAMVSLGMRDRQSMIYLENCRSDAALTLSLDIGSRIPVFTTAMGRAYLAQCSHEEREHLVDGTARKPGAPSRAELAKSAQQAVDEYRKLGCCTSFGEWQKDVNAVAIAVRPQTGRALMAINCGGPSFTLNRSFLLHEVRPMLLQLGQQLQALGAVK